MPHCIEPSIISAAHISVSLANASFRIWGISPLSLNHFSYEADLNLLSCIPLHGHTNCANDLRRFEWDAPHCFMRLRQSLQNAGAVYTTPLTTSTVWAFRSVHRFPIDAASGCTTITW